MSEQELINLVINGDKSKFEIIIRKYNQRLFRIGMGILKNEDEVEDAMQEAYIKAYKSLQSFEQRSSFTTWLSRILINECLMSARNRKQLTGLDEPEVETMHHFTFNPEHQTMNNELKKAIEEAIQQLPEKYRLVFMLREVEAVSVAETGELLDLSEGNVKARLSRAREMLRTSLLSVYPATELFDFNLLRCDRIVKNVMTRI